MVLFAAWVRRGRNCAEGGGEIAVDVYAGSSFVALRGVVVHVFSDFLVVVEVLLVGEVAIDVDEGVEEEDAFPQKL